MQIKLQAIAGSENVLPQVMTLVGFCNGTRKPLRGQGVFSAQKDVGNVRLDRESGHDCAFDELVRIPLHQQPVFECAGLHLVGIDHEVSRVGNLLTKRYERPLQPGWKTGVASAAQIRVSLPPSASLNSSSINIRQYKIQTTQNDNQIGDHQALRSRGNVCT